MGDQFWLSDAQVERLLPYLPRSRGKARVDDRRVLSGIIHVQRSGLRWRDAPTVWPERTKQPFCTHNQTKREQTFTKPWKAWHSKCSQ